MSVKASVSISEAQEAYARDLVSQGRYATLSAVVQQGLELLREQSQATEALRELLTKRQNGTFVSLFEGEQRTQDMIARKKTEHGL